MVEEEAAWGAAVKHEPPWYPGLAVICAIVLWVNLPETLALPRGYSWMVTGLEVALLGPVIYTRQSTKTLDRRVPRILSMLLIALINVANIISLVELINQLLSHTTIKGGGTGLLLSAAAIWFTNVIVFGLWYWELDRGGPYVRRTKRHRQPDFLFPQMATPYCAASGWAPDFVDYLYVSFTNATAFSPTDTMPLTNWAKLLMMVQSFASLVTVALVAARAVNILR